MDAAMRFMKRWAASALRILIWESISSATRTDTGSRFARPDNESRLDQQNAVSGRLCFKTCMIPRGLMSHLEDRTDLLIDQKYDHGYQHAFKQIKWRHSKTPRKWDSPVILPLIALPIPTSASMASQTLLRRWVEERMHSRSSLLPS